MLLNNTVRITCLSYPEVKPLICYGPRPGRQPRRPARPGARQSRAHGEHHGAVRWHGRSPLSPGPAPRDRLRSPSRHPPRRRDHRDRQHRRRPVDARAQDLPRPRHRHVHPRGRHRSRARLGPARGDVEHEGGARRVRRGADVVRARRPRPGHPSGPHPDARRRLLPLPGDRGAVPSLAARRPAPADERRPRRDPRRRRRRRLPLRASGRALPGVLGAAARGGARRGRGGRRSRRRDSCARA